MKRVIVIVLLRSWRRGCLVAVALRDDRLRLPWPTGIATIAPSKMVAAWKREGRDAATIERLFQAELARCSGLQVPAPRSPAPPT